jgi:arsenite oxidase large subunit
MDPPGRSMPNCLITARIANRMVSVLRAIGAAKYADQFKGCDWKTEEAAFIDGYHANSKGGKFVTYERLTVMGVNGSRDLPPTSRTARSPD